MKPECRVIEPIIETVDMPVREWSELITMHMKNKGKDRLDKIMVNRGLLKTRERAKALIMAGKVAVDGKSILKAGTLIRTDVDIVLRENDMPFVSRGGLKLDAALKAFCINPREKVVMDIGCSTGGFTDCVLKKGAHRVYAIDVGYGQFDWTLRQDQRIVLFEKTNIRHVDKTLFPEEIDLIVIDVSFISLLKVLPTALEFLRGDGTIVALVKPQFEVGKEMVEKGGIIRDPAQRFSALSDVCRGAERIGLKTVDTFESPVHGQKGNIEYFVCLRRR